MAQVAFKQKSDGTKQYFHFQADMFQDYCAWNIIFSFRVNDDAYDWYDEGYGDERTVEEESIPESKLFKTVLGRAFEAHVGTTFFIGDEKGGHADKHLFSHIPKRPFILDIPTTYCYPERKAKCTAKLSPYYHNPNSGNQCRHVIITTEPVEETE